MTATCRQLSRQRRLLFHQAGQKQRASIFDAQYRYGSHPHAIPGLVGKPHNYARTDPARGPQRSHRFPHKSGGANAQKAYHHRHKENCLSQAETSHLRMLQTPSNAQRGQAPATHRPKVTASGPKAHKMRVRNPSHQRGYPQVETSDICRVCSLTSHYGRKYVFYGPKRDGKGACSLAVVRLLSPTARGQSRNPMIRPVSR